MSASRARKSVLVSLVLRRLDVTSLVLVDRLMRGPFCRSHFGGYCALTSAQVVVTKEQQEQMPIAGQISREAFVRKSKFLTFQLLQILPRVD
jgi:hypothetical protein